MNERRVQGVLAGLVAFDVTLTTWAGAFPELWFRVFHGVPYDGADPEGFLRRCAANWAAFALMQAIALARWKRDAVWLAVVAGVRLSDVFTDATYVTVARDTTWFARAVLAPSSVMNVVLGVFLLRAYRWRLAGGGGAR
jgi:hypothetical protein